MNPGDGQFVTNVFPAEVAVIRARRETLKLDTSELEGPPSVDRGLIGLAFSGGGIRSATFCLGVLQTLHEREILPRFDYLSTVSGGGYTGACISSVLNEPVEPPLAERGDVPAPHARALDDRPGIGESVALQHLRNTCEYLVPGGLLNSFRLPTLFLRGILINLFVFLPYIILAVLVTEVVYQLGHAGSFRIDDVFRIAPFVALGLFLLVVLTYPMISRIWYHRLSWSGRNRYENLLALLLVVSLVTIALVPFLNLAGLAIDTSWPDAARGLMALFHGTMSLRTSWPWALLFGVLVLFMMAGKASANVGRLGGRLVLYALGLIGPLILLGVYLALIVVEVDSPFLDRSFRATLDAGMVSEEMRAQMAYRGMEVSPDATVDVVVPGARWVVRDEDDAYHLRQAHEDATEDLQVRWRDMWDIDDALFFGLGIFLFLFNTAFVNVNLTSIHGFYRDRLSRTFLFRVDRDGQIVPNDHLRMSALNAPGSAAPYHLVNVALNLEGEGDDTLRGRRADFFIFSRCFTGGPRTGYCATTDMERAVRLDLGTAMAISGAAAAPNMGSTTVRQLSFIMTALNIRLGYWLPNPAHLGDATLLRRIAYSLGVGPRYLVREAMNRLTATGAYVNVSDGGHIENLALYELLRRRCRVIVAVDGEADPALRFNGLVKLIRYAHIDMGVDIHIDLEPIRRADGGFSRNHGAIGTIDYGDGEMGYLVYIKLSMTGDENVYVRDYDAHHPAFPFESTADQFFDEAQFEAYRALGQHAATILLGEAAGVDGLDELVDGRPRERARAR